MSYRSIKTVLGETSLERKCRFLFGASLLVLITASFWWYGTQTGKLVYEQNRNTGRLLVEEEIFAAHWLPSEKKESSQEFVKILNHLIERLGKQKHTITYIDPRARGPKGPQDKFERELCVHFLREKPDKAADSENPQFGERPLPDLGEYQYYEPIRVESSSCNVVCHQPDPGGSGTYGADTQVDASGHVSSASTEPLSPGDVMYVAKLTIPTGPIQNKLNRNTAILISTAIITAFLAMVTSYMIVRYVIVKPLRHLRDVSDSISRGNIALRADIHTGAEFEELAVAFNRMLRHLVTAQEELRQVNATLDGKVDELAQLNMRLYEMNTVKSDFLATMSHELRTPLNSILGFSEVLASIAALDEKQRRYVQNIQKSGRTLLEMINDILDLAKMESGKMNIRLSDFRVGQVVGAQCDMARPLTEKKNIDMETCIPADLPPMRQDQARVQQILNNLLSNAIKFTPEGGRITVNVARDDEDFLLLQVSDTGVGIAEEDQQTIFEKFRQGRTGAPSGDAMTREYSGTGLGLSIVKELCKLLGGTVSVHSVLGKGSTFTVRLPWTLQEQPRLDSSLIEGLDDFAKPRFEFVHDHALPTAEPSTTDGGTGS